MAKPVSLEMAPVGNSSSHSRGKEDDDDERDNDEDAGISNFSSEVVPNIPRTIFSVNAFSKGEMRISHDSVDHMVSYRR
jgi:hypothetical protein